MRWFLLKIRGSCQSKNGWPYRQLSGAKPGLLQKTSVPSDRTNPIASLGTPLFHETPYPSLLELHARIALSYSFKQLQCRDLFGATPKQLRSIRSYFHAFTHQPHASSVTPLPLICQGWRINDQWRAEGELITYSSL